ncbi:hypothetical protein [Maribacter sp. 2210JD10-5]|uniref:hypothetical protein n=1 Tax=Maribacter sp. 2210JD10-5 TaxID=3386272 RepID=UPI0039BCADD6
MRNYKITSELIEEAKKNPNGWIYVLDKEYEGKEEVPPEFIQGAWKVDGKGEIEGDFMPNPKYHGNK